MNEAAVADLIAMGMTCLVGLVIICIAGIGMAVIVNLPEDNDPVFDPRAPLGDWPDKWRQRKRRERK